MEKNGSAFAKKPSRRILLRGLPLDRRMEAQTDKSAGPAGCWPWKGNLTRGYGRVNIGRIKAKPHRVAWEMANGPIPAGMFVLHRCDNPACVNPAHLAIGTHDDNMADMVTRGRSNRGERHWNWQGGNSRNYREGRNRREARR